MSPTGWAQILGGALPCVCAGSLRRVGFLAEVLHARCRKKAPVLYLTMLGAVTYPRRHMSLNMAHGLLVLLKL